MKLVAVTACSDHTKTDDRGIPTVYQPGQEFEMDDKTGASLVSINAAAKVGTEEAKLAKISAGSPASTPTVVS